MHLAYVDETYTHAIYSFAVLLVHDERDAAMQREVLSIPERFAEHGVDFDAELRGSDLFHSRRAWKALRDQPPLRVHAYRLGLKAIEACDGKIALVSIERTEDAVRDLSVARMQAVEKLLPCQPPHARSSDRRSRGISISAPSPGPRRAGECLRPGDRVSLEDHGAQHRLPSRPIDAPKPPCGGFNAVARASGHSRHTA